MINISRSKVHPKIIFKAISKGNNVLVIGINNFDIVEVLKHKKARISEFNSNQLNEILEELEEFDNEQFDFIILNLELSKLLNVNKVIALASDKSKIAIFRVRNNNLITRNLRTKYNEVLKSFKENDLNIIQRFYCRKNSIYKNIFARFFTYYVVFITSKNGDELAFQEAFTEKFLRRFSSFLKSKEAVFTSERK